MKFRVSQVAAIIGATVEGDPELEVSNLAKIEEGKPGDLCFLANPKYENYIYETKASAIIVSRDFTPKSSISATLLRVEDPYSAFASLLEMAQNMVKTSKKGISPTAHIGEDVKVGDGCYVGPYAVVMDGCKLEDGVQIHSFSHLGENVVVGKNTVIFPHVTVYNSCEIGQDCILHSGSVIGSDGFGFAPNERGELKKIPQTGKVILGNKVEIGANSTIDRATLGATELGDGVKIDNLVQIAHNVRIGNHTGIAAQTGIAGSTEIGMHVMIGGQAGIVGHLKIADQTKIDAQSGVNRSISETGQAFRGSPIQAYRQQLKSEVLFRKLEEMYRKIQGLEEALARLEK